MALKEKGLHCMKNIAKISIASVVLISFIVMCISSSQVLGCYPPPPRLPTAVLEVTPERIAPGLEVQLDGHNSVSHGGTITKYEWDFDNDGVYDYSETAVYAADRNFDGITNYTYASSGTYTVRLRVTNSYGYTGVSTHTVTVVVPITYTYDEVGNRSQMVDPTGITNYDYDSMSRLVSVTNPDGKVIRYEYDADGHRTKLTDPDNNETTYTYDDNGRLAEVDVSSYLAIYEYDTLNRLTRANYPNNTYVEYSYSPTRGWLTGVYATGPDDVVLSSYFYTHDNVGNRISVSEDGGAVTYGYDDIYQLTSETRTGTHPYSITYQYDASGNRTQMVKDGVTTNYVYGVRGRLWTQTTNSVTTDYTYDGSWNMTSKTVGGNTTTYTWDWRNLLASVSEPAGTTMYEYDGDGTRVKKTQGTTVTKYVNDVALPLVQVLAETNNSGVTQGTYDYGQGLIRVRRGGTNSFFLSDGLGTVRQLVNSSGAITDSYTYDGYGNRVASSGSTVNTYGFTGQQQFAEADSLVFLRARYYDPRIGRFISRDPLLSPSYYAAKGIDVQKSRGWHERVKPGWLNAYVYCLNNPVNLVDPTGGCSRKSDVSNIIRALQAEVPSWLADEAITKTLGGISGAACAGRLCAKRNTPREAFAAALGECTSIFNEYTQLPPGSVDNTAKYISECMSICESIVKSADYANNCCPAKRE
jgi:RHS repeat-associated protein